MIKGLTTTVVSACLAGGVGIGLFFVKHEVKEQEARLAELNQEIQRNQEAVHVLKAEWSYLNDPARLRQLSEKFLGMRVVGPAQITSLSSLPREGLPAVARAETAKPAAPVAIAAAKNEPAKKGDAPKSLAKAEPAKAEPGKPAAKVAAVAPVTVPQPAGLMPAPLPVKTPPVATQSAAPPSRNIVIQSPALAQTQASAGEVR